MSRATARPDWVGRRSSEIAGPCTALPVASTGTLMIGSGNPYRLSSRRKWVSAGESVFSRIWVSVLMHCFCPWNESHEWMNFLSSARVVRLRAGSRHTSESPNSMRSSRDSSSAVWANSASGEVHRSPCTSMVAPEASVLGHTRRMMSFARVRRVVLNVTVAAGRFFVDLKHDRFQNSQIRELFWRKMAVSGFASASFESVSHGFELSTLRFGASKSVQNLSRVRSTFGNRMGAESVVRIRHRRKALCGAVRMSWAAAAKAHETYGG